LCFDEPKLKPVYDDWSSGIGKGKLALKIVDYADKQSKIETVLNWAKAANPSKYEEFAPYTASVPPKPPKPTPNPPPPKPSRRAWIVVVIVVLFATLLVIGVLVRAKSTLIPGSMPNTSTIAPPSPLTPSPNTTPTAPHTATPMPSPKSTPWPLTNAQTYPEQGAQCSTTPVSVSGPIEPSAVKILFDPAIKDSWCTWVLNLEHFDASRKQNLCFWVKSEKGKEQFEVGLKDISTKPGAELKVPQTAAEKEGEWKQIIIPLQNWKQQDLSALENLSLGFKNQFGSGVIYVQGFTFEP
jgi:hypothetical protein